MPSVCGVPGHVLAVSVLTDGGELDTFCHPAIPPRQFHLAQTGTFGHKGHDIWLGETTCETGFGHARGV